MSGKVIDLADYKLRKGEVTEEETKRVDADQLFSEIQRRNEENKRRVEKERNANNCGTIKSYRLKE